MIVLVNAGRYLMVLWAIYGLVLIFAPALMHQPPQKYSGIIQFLLAYGVGYCLDRLLGVLRRRRASALNGPRTDDARSV